MCIFINKVFINELNITWRRHIDQLLESVEVQYSSNDVYNEDCNDIIPLSASNSSSSTNASSSNTSNAQSSSRTIQGSSSSSSSDEEFYDTCANDVNVPTATRELPRRSQRIRKPVVRLNL